MILSYVRRVLGPEAVDRVLALAGGDGSLVDLAQPASWVTSAGTLAIAEPACMCRGDRRCVYRLRWKETTASPADADAVDASRERIDSFVARFEQLHTMATELAQAGNVDKVLGTIADRAGIAVDAPRYLLA